MDFKDLARSGTAPEPSKAKLLINYGDNNINNYNNSISLLASRPKTRSLDNDINDFNIDLRSSNKITNYAQNSDKNKNLSEENKIFKRLQEEEEYLKAIENFQAAVEDWSGRKDNDVITTGRQPTASSSIRPTKQQQQQHQEGKSHANIIHSAYTQNVPNIILQTSKKSADITNSRPQTTARDRELRTINQQTHNNHISDIRAAYGADIIDKVKPKSSSAITKRNIPVTRNYDDTNNNYESGNNNNNSIRYDNQSSRNPDDYNGGNSKLPESVIDAKRPTSNRINKYRMSSSSGTKAVTTTTNTNTRDIDSDVDYNCSNNTNSNVNNFQKPSSARKFPSNANKLLKASLAYNQKSFGKSENLKNNELDLFATVTKETNTLLDQYSNIPVDVDNNIMYEASYLAESSNKGNTINRSHTINKNTLHNTNQIVNKDITNNFSHIHNNQNLRLSRGPSSSPIMIMGGSDNELNKSESEAFFVEVEDSDGLDSSFDDSPILAEYLKKQEQLKANENISHTKHTGSSDNGTISRPQSRKLYLGTGKESAKSSDSNEITNVTTIQSYSNEGAKVIKTQPRSAGGASSSRKVTTSHNGTSDNMFEIPIITKMNSYDDIFSSMNKNDAPKNTLETKQGITISDGPRPPSRQGSAFPTHLIDTNNERERNQNENEINKGYHTTNKNTVVLHTDNFKKIEKIQYMDSSKVSDQNTVLNNTNKVNVKDNISNTKISPTIVAKSIKESDHIILDTYDIERNHNINDIEASSCSSLGLKTSPNLSYNNNRPPSRQKVAAQHLFEGQPPPPIRNTDNTTSTISNNTTSNNKRWTSRTAASSLNYNPQQDGFLDINDQRDNESMPFKIKINYGTRNNSIEYDKSKHILTDGSQQKSDLRIRPTRSFDIGNAIDNNIDPLESVRAIDISKPRSKTAATSSQKESFYRQQPQPQGASYFMNNSSSGVESNRYKDSSVNTNNNIILSTRESRSSYAGISSDRNKKNKSGSYFNYNSSQNYNNTTNNTITTTSNTGGWTDMIDTNSKSKIFTNHRINSATTRKTNELDRSEREDDDDNNISYEDNDDHSIMV